MSSAAERMLRRKVFSAVFLTGKGFDEYGWAQHFMKLVCQRRKVFLDGELFIKGAVVRGTSLLSGKRDPGFTALCSGRAAAGVTMRVDRNGQPMEFPVLNAGDPVFSSDMELRLLPESGECLEFVVEPVSTRKKKLVRVPAPPLPEREPKTSYLDVSLSFPDEDSMSVRMKDAGFGELFPPGGASSFMEVSFSSQDAEPPGRIPDRLPEEARSAPCCAVARSRRTRSGSRSSASGCTPRRSSATALQSIRFCSWMDSRVRQCSGSLSRERENVSWLRNSAS